MALDILDDDKLHADATRTEKWWRWIRDQTSEPLSGFNLTVMALIALATLIMILETMPELDGIEKWVWEVIEAICVLCFSVRRRQPERAPPPPRCRPASD